MHQRRQKIDQLTCGRTMFDGPIITKKVACSGPAVVPAQFTLEQRLLEPKTNLTQGREAEFCDDSQKAGTTKKLVLHGISCPQSLLFRDRTG